MNEEDVPHQETEVTSLIVEPATKNDAESIYRVQSQTWLDTYPNKDAGITREDIRLRIEGEHGELVSEKIKRWKERIESDNEKSKIFVARVDGKVVGFTAPGFIDGQRRIGAIYVLPEAQGKGVGSALMKQALSWHGNSDDIYLRVATYNHNAINFYKGFGFEETGNSITDQTAKDRGIVEIPEIEMVLRTHTANSSVPPA